MIIVACLRSQLQQEADPASQFLVIESYISALERQEQHWEQDRNAQTAAIARHAHGPSPVKTRAAKVQLLSDGPARAVATKSDRLQTFMQYARTTSNNTVQVHA